MKTSARKAKGRTLQNTVAAAIVKQFGLNVSDVRGAIMGETGEDIKLSHFARGVFPFSIECKNQEKSKTVYDWYKQASSNCHEESYPAVIMKRNYEKPLIVLDLQDFLDYTSQLKSEKKLNNLGGTV